MKVWGRNAIINLSDCIPDTIRSRDHILAWGSYLIDHIEMKPFGDAFIERFGLNNKNAVGYSYFQAIETSNICAHFSEYNNTAFINIFSCKDYHSNKVVGVCYKFFGFKSYQIRILTMMSNGDIL